MYVVQQVYFIRQDNKQENLKMDIFEEKIQNYIKSGSSKSPIWVFFEKNETAKDEAKCQLCNCIIFCKLGSTTGMSNHIHNCHGSLTKYDAAKHLKKLLKLKGEATCFKTISFFFSQWTTQQETTNK